MPPHLPALSLLLLLCLGQNLTAQETRQPTGQQVAAQAEQLVKARRYADAEKLINTLLRQGLYLLAEPPLQAWVSDQPKQATARYMLGFCLMAQFRNRGAEPHLAEAVRLKPRKVSWMHAYAKALNHNGQHKQALRIVKSAHDIEPRPALLFAAGLCLLNMGESAAAEKELRACLKDAPKHAEGHYKLGQALTEQGRYADAIAPLRRSLELEPQQVEARYLLGMAESRAGDKAKAVEAYEIVVAKVSSHVGALYNLGRLLLKTGNKKRGRDVLARFKKASVLEDQLQFLRHMVKTEPTNVDKRLELAQTLLKAGLSEEAMKNLQAAQGRAPRRPEIYRGMAEVFRRLGRHTDARRAESYVQVLEKQARR